MVHSGCAAAFDSFVVSDIRVEGLQRISAGTVFNYLPIKVGDTLDETRSAEALRALFKTGFFKDVRLEREGTVLVVWMTERPSIASIKFSGNKEFNTEEMTKALKSSGMAEGRVFDRSLLDRTEQELRRLYFNQGKYGVKITTTVTPLERNRVAIDIQISEGKVARIREINVVGNTVFSDKALLRKFQLSPPTLWSFYTHNDQYSKQKLSADLEVLRSYYMDRGYLNFSIDSTQVAISPDRKDIYITINITEGRQYTVDQVKLTGDLVVPAQELTKLVQLHSGSVFSRKAVTETTTKITDRLGNEGYAFANVNAIPEVDEAQQRVSVTFFVDPGKRVYVRRINMVGNTKTRDEVLRREMRQMEGAWVSTAKINRSRTRLERLGYFTNVNVEMPAVPGTPDQVDVNFSVEEQPSGNLLAALGYSQSEGVLLQFSITQDNFLGSGKRLSFNFNNSDVNTIYSVGYTNPYYTIDGVSRGFRVYYQKTDASAANISKYTTDAYGGSMDFGLPVNEYDTAKVGFGYKHLKLKAVSDSPEHVTTFIADSGDQFDTVLLTGSFVHDTRNRGLFADRGLMQRFTTQMSAPGSDLEYYKLSYKHQWYRPLTEHLTLSLNGEVAYGDGYGGTDQLPFFENFYAGGGNSVRGFEDNSLGPRDSAGDPMGGNLKTVGSVEVIFPTPFSQSKQVRLSTFLDFGNVFGPDQDLDFGSLRYSTGVSLIWISPFGPLQFSLAKALNAKDGDQTQNFHFSVGTLF